jgi:hypothetical protein
MRMNSISDMQFDADFKPWYDSLIVLGVKEDKQKNPNHLIRS